MPCLPPSDIVDQRDDIRVDQIAADNLVSGDYPSDLGQVREFGVGTQAPVGGVLQHRLPSEGQGSSHDEGTGR